ncbi:hypothetical protein B0H13DRAFT_2473309 [Mycena leptocephala]|nr:hypothetical protein B0H13DRAFT_2473309 [Mycena leptocephala]
MKITETVTTIVSLLGGPQFNADDIDWALDLPAGQRLLEWLVSQVDELSADDGMNGSDALRAALQAISLEEDEVQMSVLHYLRGIRSDEGRAKEEYLVAEATRLEAETESLKSRLQQTKTASQSLAQAIKFLASEIEKTDSDTLAAEDRLSELSLQAKLQADVTVLGSVNGSLGLLDGCDFAQDESSLSSISSVRTVVTDRFQSQMRAIDAAARHLPTPTEIQAECGRLEATLNADLIPNHEIARLCQALEDPVTGKDVLATVLAENREPQAQPPAIDAAAELEAAWARDQEGLIDARGALLDEAITAFSDIVLPPLTVLSENITSQNAHTSEAQALVGALRGEIQDILEDVRAAQDAGEAQIIPSAEESKDAELQAGLTSLLKQLKDLRPRDAPPLVLLSQEDILSELHGVYEREEAARRQEEEWIANLLPALRNLEAIHAPLLDAAYAHSPMNTSAPFATPPDVQTVYADAKRKADDLGEAINNLQDDVKTLTNERAKRRIEHFVTKWAK